MSNYYYTSDIAMRIIIISVIIFDFSGICDVGFAQVIAFFSCLIHNVLYKENHYYYWDYYRNVFA